MRFIWFRLYESDLIWFRLYGSDLYGLGSMVQATFMIIKKGGETKSLSTHTSVAEGLIHINDQEQ
jgi:hypothetical protein